MEAKLRAFLIWVSDKIEW